MGQAVSEAGIPGTGWELGIEGRGTEIWGSAEAGAGVKALTHPEPIGV